MADELKTSEEWWVGGSDDELRAWRRAAIRRAAEVEEGALEARRLQEVYEKGAEMAEDQAREAERLANKDDEAGDPESAEANRNRAAELRGLAKKNYKLADAKAKLAFGKEREAQKERALDVRLGNEVRRRAREWIV